MSAVHAYSLSRALLASYGPSAPLAVDRLHCCLNASVQLAVPPLLLRAAGGLALGQGAGRSVSLDLGSLAMLGHHGLPLARSPK